MKKNVLFFLFFITGIIVSCGTGTNENNEEKLKKEDVETSQQLDEMVENSKELENEATQIENELKSFEEELNAQQ